MPRAQIHRLADFPEIIVGRAAHRGETMDGLADTLDTSNMPFPREVREEALVAAARHCCVCHRYQGVKVEVHHIIQEAQGGPNTLDNAIVLCFDCHADAGHYNPKHPRGTKFSPTELRRHRDAWFAGVREHRIATPPVSALIHTRHLVCKSPEEADALFNGRFKDLPFARAPLLVENPVAAFAREILRAVGPHRSSFSWGAEYANAEDYAAHHSDAQVSRLAYFSAMRIPGRDEIADPLSTRLANEGVSASDLARAFCYQEECGSPAFHELIRYRPLLFAFLEVRNEADTPIRLRAMTARAALPAGNLRYRALVELGGEPASMLLPQAALRPGESALIPHAVLLGPLEGDSEQHHVEAQLQRDAWILLAHERWPSASTFDFRAIGPSVRPESLTVVVNDRFEEVSVHSLDLENTFTLTRFWEVGSCPHLFWHIQTTGDWVYGGPLLGRAHGSVCSEFVPVPASADSFRIAELEQEVTYLDQVALHARRSSVILAEAVTLTENQAVSCIVACAQGCGCVLEVRGHYVPLRTSSPAPRVASPDTVWTRSCVVERHLRNLALGTSAT